MKYKLKIISEGGKYVGYALQNDEVVFQTNPCKDSIVASRELSKFVGSNQVVTFTNKQPSNVDQQVSFQQITPAPPVPNRPVAPAPQRRCCGR